MSQKSSDPQAISFVSQPLKRDTIEGLLDGVGSEDSPMSLMNHNIKGNSWYSLLEGKIGVLNGFLLELRKQ
jgi:hypothetical protein